MSRLRSSPWITWLVVAPVLAWTVFEDIHREAWLHIVAVGVMILAGTQPELTARRQRLEYLAFALFQVSMAIAVRGIITDGGGSAVAVIGFWVLGDMLLILGYRKHQRELRNKAASEQVETREARS